MRINGGSAVFVALLALSCASSDEIEYDQAEQPLLSGWGYPIFDGAGSQWSATPVGQQAWKTLDEAGCNTTDFASTSVEGAVQYIGVPVRMSDGSTPAAGFRIMQVCVESCAACLIGGSGNSNIEWTYRWNGVQASGWRTQTLITQTLGVLPEDCRNVVLATGTNDTLEIVTRLKKGSTRGVKLSAIRGRVRFPIIPDHLQLVLIPDLTVGGAGNPVANFSWYPSSFYLAQYRVEKSVNGGPYTHWMTDIHLFVEGPLVAPLDNETVCLRVRKEDSPNPGDISFWSEPACVPGVTGPSNLQVTSIPGGWRLSWTNNSSWTATPTMDKGFLIRRQVSATEFERYPSITVANTAATSYDCTTPACASAPPETLWLITAYWNNVVSGSPFYQAESVGSVGSADSVPTP